MFGMVLSFVMHWSLAVWDFGMKAGEGQKEPLCARDELVSVVLGLDLDLRCFASDWACQVDFQAPRCTRLVIP